MSLRATFDESPELYDRTRPICPPALFDDLVANLPTGARVLEIGCGTGQATVPLAERGLVIVCVELGGSLAAFARRKLARFPAVEVVHSSFEAWTPESSAFDGVVSVNAFHWIDPEVRYAKPAALLRDGGLLAIGMANYVVPEDAAPFWTDVQDDYEAVGAGRLEPVENRPESVGDYREEMEASGLFTVLDVRRYVWQLAFTATGYRELLETSSWHKALPEDARRELLERIQRRVEAQPGGSITSTLAGTLTIARRRQRHRRTPPQPA